MGVVQLNGFLGVGNGEVMVSVRLDIMPDRIGLAINAEKGDAGESIALEFLEGFERRLSAAGVPCATFKRNTKKGDKPDAIIIAIAPKPEE